MPRRQAPPSVDSEAERRFQDSFDTVLAELARRQQQPPDTEQVSRPRKARLWGLADPRVDPETFKQALMTTGFQGPDLESMLIVQEHPDLAEVYGQPQGDPEMAADLTTLARYPFRLGTYRHILDPDERTREAERIHRDWMKSRGASVPEPDAEAEPVVGGY